jgi:hypothetical protein
MSLAKVIGSQRTYTCTYVHFLQLTLVSVLYTTPEVRYIMNVHSHVSLRNWRTDFD